jgi:hypothetical protein
LAGLAGDFERVHMRASVRLTFTAQSWRSPALRIGKYPLGREAPFVGKQNHGTIAVRF